MAGGVGWIVLPLVQNVGGWLVSMSPVVLQRRSGAPFRPLTEEHENVLWRESRYSVLADGPLCADRKCLTALYCTIGSKRARQAQWQSEYGDVLSWPPNRQADWVNGTQPLQCPKCGKDYVFTTPRRVREVRREATDILQAKRRVSTG